MSSEHLPANRTRTEAVMSMYYDACNIIAGEASMRAHEQIKSPDKAETFYVFDETAGTDPQRLKSKRFGNYDAVALGNPYHSRGTVDLLLTRPEEDDSADPQLMAHLRDDLLLPLAAFSPRANGSCSYVRLGQEMVDENFVVTPYTDRKAIVELLRNMQDQDKVVPHEDRETIMEPLRDLFQSELTAHKLAIQKQLAPALSRDVRSACKGSRLSRNWHFWVMGEGGPKFSTLNAWELNTRQIALPDGRVLDLMLASDDHRPRVQRNWTPGRVQLMALVRDSIAIPLVTFEDGAITNAQTGTELSLQDVELVRAGLSAPAPATQAQLERAENAYRPTMIKMIIRYLRNTGQKDLALKLSAMQTAIDPDGSSPSSEIVKDKQYQELLKKYRKDTIRNQPSWREHQDATFGEINYSSYEAIGNLVNMAQARKSYTDGLSSGRKPLAKLFERFEVAKQFEEHFGPHRPAAEKLLETVGSMALQGSQFSGLWENVKILQDTGDIELGGEISMPEPEIFRVQTEGRPIGMVGAKPEIIYDIEIDRREPITIDDDELAELQEQLGALVARRKFMRS